MDAQSYNASHPGARFNGADHAWHLSAVSTAELDALVDPSGSRARMVAVTGWLVLAIAATAFGVSAALVF